MPPLVRIVEIENKKMETHNKSIHISILIAVLLAGSAVSYGQKNLDHAAAAVLAAGETSSQVRLKLVDGSSIAVDEAWESEQGVWYRQGGMSHLVARERVKAIERGASSKSTPDFTEAKVVVTDDVNNRQDEPPSSNGVAAQPVWIYLIGGARFEADSVIESASGVWYRRGPLSIFVERSRIDHIEREALETIAASDSNSRKERAWTTGNLKIDGLIKHNGAKFGVDPYLIFCVMEQESHFNTRALSPKGARGLMQLMPGTSARFGVIRPSDPAQNIAGGTRYLKQLISRFDGRIDLVLASYNAGEGAVLKFGRRVPPYRETRDYVKRISYRYRRAQPAVTAKNSLGPAVRPAL
jgi:Zn-finger nucleic acid-binding protein